MWFDVEKRYNTTISLVIYYTLQLWFDVEKRYNTTVDPVGIDIKSLWFDVEKRYNTTNNVHYVCGMSCGLM